MFDDHKIHELRDAANALTDWFASQNLDKGDAAMICLIIVSAIITETGPDKLEEGRKLAHRSIDSLVSGMAAVAEREGLFDRRH